MSRRNRLFVCLLAALVVCQPLGNSAFSWGFFGHKLINRMAVFTLPNGLIGFYKRHIEYITEHAVDPDSRRGIVPEEAARHYIDIDHYGTNPFQVVPRPWFEAVKKFSEDTLQAYGIVPWHIDLMMRRLTGAFKQENLDLILRYSADIGHYIADSHVPLHTTENYNGQLTNQKGIHGFWESRVPELLSDGYDFWVGKATYVEKPLDRAWQTVEESHAAVDSVLRFEAQLNKEYSPDQKYASESRNNQTVRVYSQGYTKAYSDMLNGMVERRMRKSIITVGSLWMTAWVNAGQPNLERLETKAYSDSLRKAMEAEELLWRTGKRPAQIKGHDD
jgi:hypothetical protein